jgi:hypothetical protein
MMDAANPQTGLRYGGRIAEDFKLSTGTWVRVGAFRENLLRHLAPEVRDLVIAGENRNYIAVLAVPADPNTVDDRRMLAHLRAKLTALADQAISAIFCGAIQQWWNNCMRMLPAITSSVWFPAADGTVELP